MDPIRSIYEDDPDMMEIVQEFADELPGRAESAETLLREGDLGELQRLRTSSRELEAATDSMRSLRLRPLSSRP